MLIGIDASRALRATRTGTERYSLEIIRHLLALDTAGRHRWRLYTDATPPTGFFLEDEPGASVARVDLRILPARRLWTQHTLAREIWRDPPDLLFVPAHVLPWMWPPARLPASVVTVHDLGYYTYPDTRGRLHGLYLKWSTRWSVAVARQVIAVSQTTAGDLRRFCGVPADRLTVIAEAVAPPRPVSCEAVAALRHRYGLSRPYALYVGTLQPRKNLSRLVAAYGLRQRDGGVAWDLVLAGQPGPLGDRLRSQVAGAGLADRVHFPGYVPENDLPALMRGACFFCFPSLFEGFGLPVLEAQQHGVPVMTANSSALPEVAGDAALLVDPTDVDAIADGMLRLSRDEGLRQQLIAAGYENVKRFSWEKAARETLAVFESVLKGK